MQLTKTSIKNKIRTQIKTIANYYQIREIVEKEKVQKRAIKVGTFLLKLQC